MAKTAAKVVEAEGSAESAKGGRNFKTSPDVEAFYRFVHENGLRREAGIILKTVHARLKALSKKKKKRGRKKIQ
jgi:hypothetical protein